jgi:hypothetical protein
MNSKKIQTNRWMKLKIKKTIQDMKEEIKDMETLKNN